ncbi:type IV toxin-antitoxin system AbiEi family antitoxin domain-containing protein [Pseudarthrobacter sp. J75]|uniref:type IV toxin-antitoxin system AbiEi family antitoxin domain-containing protein n=1 Tax=unclassified Pseudarthrobacter TaxID=2647000 RepID=UPI002E823F6B|nr:MULTISPECIES: type IV toxin-antitoxin system AbiEi family antitoxin domain-containing protein [unclassified Pseudarthrobacter]MEE2522549.1 type IV toxin-antitoxin system AbiEi family antitoxin domain-containing protein [Pseudarthrobacter sp. J47]MEE2529107.1 type IV toxin-antitoxin system AbiEi family antitoxin domain-containing protein [Pseudarthrobacter sp. J75]
MDSRILPAHTRMWRTEQLAAAGFTSRSIGRLVQEGGLVRLRRGCYVRGDWWGTLHPDARARVMVHAHSHGTLTTSAGGFVYSHTSAARLRKLTLWRADGRIHLTQETTPSKCTHGAGVVAHTRKLMPEDKSFVAGLPCTSLERTVIDCSLMFNVRQALILVDHASHLGADLAALRRRCAALSGRNGVVALRRALELADPLCESAGESLTRELLVRLNIEAPESQFEADSPAGRHRMDFAWPKRKVALEFDGKTKYFDYRPTEEVLFQERRREKALMEMGWVFIRVEWKHLFRETEFKYRVLRAFERGSQG